MTVYAWIKALHLIAATLWVGGLFFAYVVLNPSLAAIEAPQRMLLHTQVFRRFFLVVWHLMPLVLITGFVMLLVFMQPQNAPWQVHAMLGLGLIMAVLFLLIVFGPYRQFRRTTDRTRMANSLKTIRRLIAANLLLGVVTVIIAGLL